MNFVEHIRVRQERAEAGFGAEQNRPATVFDAWIVRWIGVTKDTSAKGDEVFVVLWFGRSH